MADWDTETSELQRKCEEVLAQIRFELLEPALEISLMDRITPLLAHFGEMTPPTLLLIEKGPEEGWCCG